MAQVMEVKEDRQEVNLQGIREDPGSCLEGFFFYAVEELKGYVRLF